MRRDEVDDAILDEYLQKAKSLSQSKAFQEAEEYYEKAMRRCNELLRLNPENPYLHYVKAYLIYEFEGFHSSSEERRKDALREIDRAIELDPETNYYHFERGDIVAELVIPEWSLDANAIVEEEMGMRLSLFSLSHYVKGFAVDASGTHLEFLGMGFNGVEYEYDQRECLERDPKNPDCYNNLGALFHERGTRHMDASLVKRTLEMLNRAIALNPNNPAYYNNRALALHSLIKLNEAGRFKDSKIDPEKTFQEVLKDLERAVNLGPRNPYYHYNLGLMLYEAGRYGEAIKELDEAIALDSSNLYLYYKKGMIFYKLGRYSESLEQFRKALKLDEDDRVANYMVKLIEKIENENKKIAPLSRTDIERIIMEKEDELLSPSSDLRLEEIPSKMISVAKQFGLIDPDVSRENLKKLERKLLSEILSKKDLRINSIMLHLCFHCPAYWFDTEMIYGPEDYVKLASKLSGITRGQLPLSNIECQEAKSPSEEEPEKYILSFVAFGEKYTVELPYEGDWARYKPIVRVLNDIMRKTGRCERYVDPNTGDQTAYLIFCIPEYYEACRRIDTLLYRAGLKCQR